MIKSNKDSYKKHMIFFFRNDERYKMYDTIRYIRQYNMNGMYLAQRREPRLSTDDDHN